MKNIIFLLTLIFSFSAISQKTIITQTTIKNKGIIESIKIDSTIVQPDIVTVTIIKDSLIYRDTCIIQPVNQVPTAIAGPDRSITLPTNSLSITGSGKDPDGTIAAFIWTKISGPSSYAIVNNTSAIVTFNSLVQGTYTVRLTVVDNKGASASDDINIMVNAQPSTGNYVLVYSTGYDVLGDIDPQNHGQWGADAKANHLNTSNPITPTGDFHSKPTGNVSSGIRSEVQYDDGFAPSEGAIDIDIRFNHIVGNNGHFLQWHTGTPGGSASPGFWFDNGNILLNNWINKVNQGHPTGFQLQTGIVYHLRVEYKMTSTGSKTDGYFRTYINGNQIPGGSWVGQVGDGSGFWLKVGYNGWDNASLTSDIDYDNLRIWKLN